MATNLSLKKVKVSFDNFHIFSDFTFKAENGESWAILGHSGSGKTTLLRVIAGLTQLTKGKILLDGILVSNDSMIIVPPHLRGVSMVFQDLALWPHMNVQAHLKFVLKGKGLNPKDEKLAIDSIIDSTGLNKRKNAFPGTLSGGEKQRLALARALVTKPQRVLLDEPFSSLDLPLRKEMIELVLSLHKEYKFTLLHVTHDPLEALLLAENIILLDSGKIKWSGKSKTFSTSTKTKNLINTIQWFQNSL
jgi:iron(III) transport system ATP-binding protein